MAEATYPFAYGSSMLTMAEYETKETVYNLYPEMWRRFKALMEYAYTQGVPLGVGTGWRVQPNPPPPGFAAPGNSWHESVPVSPTSPTALAIDTVPDTSWNWMETNLAAYGLRSFRQVNDEPWHVQPVEAPAGRNYATTLPPIGVWNLPGGLPDEEDDMPLSDEDVDRVARAVWAFHIETTNNPDIEARPARWLLQRAFLIGRQFLGPFSGKPADDPSMLKDIHREVTK